MSKEKVFPKPTLKRHSDVNFSKFNPKTIPFVKHPFVKHLQKFDLSLSFIYYLSNFLVFYLFIYCIFDLHEKMNQS